MSKYKILFNMSGSIAAFKACELISQLTKAGHEVQVVGTPSIFHFVGRSTLEGLTGRPVLTDMYEAGRVMDHIHLARWADLAILCPASANTLAKLAHGLCNDLVGALYLAWEREKPYLIAPAMNSHMYNHPATQENLTSLAQRGARVLPTGIGPLACGEVGAGRLLDIADLLQSLEKSLHKKGDVLLTFGGTREKIDGVRFLTNLSTGSTGAQLCDHLTQKGWSVTCLRAEMSEAPKTLARNIFFTDFQSLDESLRRELDQNQYRAVIHLAAVSDFRVAEVLQNGRPQPRQGKLSSAQPLSLELMPNFKIVGRLKEYSQPHPTKIVAFKLTNTPSAEERLQAVHALFEENVDCVVHNDLSDVQAQGDQRTFIVFDSHRRPQPVAGVVGLAEWLDSHLQGEKNDPGT